ncbi:MAG TPA: GFA family protein [Burkholderiales bacterium]|nr:GFA family protein [Burkholderiales bacterium]
MLTGSCLCGGVRYEINGTLTQVRNCHCSTCRKAHSAAFRSRATVQTRDFRWTAGENLVTWFDSSPGTHRGFCSRCGSALLSRFDKAPEICGLPLGCLDTDPGVRPDMHIFVDSKAPWHEITDALPQYPKWPPR